MGWRIRVHQEEERGSDGGTSCWRVCRVWLIKARVAVYDGVL